MTRDEGAAPVAVLIPALDEARTIATVIRVAREAALGPVVVIDDGSTDRTAEVAAAAGAEVLRLDRNRGKGGALDAGARARPERVLLLLDADLTGLTPDHLHALAAPVLEGRADMARGVFRGGRWRTSLAQRLFPALSGQRAVERSRLLEVEGLAASRYGVEIAITRHAALAGWRSIDVPLVGVSQVMKEEKRGAARGVLVRLRMYGEILLELSRRALARRPRPTSDQRNAPKR